MNSDFGTAFLLFVVGMITVFSILTLITFFGKWLILFINRYFPEKVSAAAGKISRTTHEIEPKKLAAIVTAVDILSQGKAKVTAVKRADH